MKKGLLTTLLTSAFILGGAAVPSFANNLPNDVELNTVYAVEGTTSTTKAEGIKANRDNISNALNNSSSSTFYSVGSHNFSKFTFGHRFYNIDDKPDINFHEVTWGNSWHEEAVEVYLVNPVIKAPNGANGAYLGNDLVNADDNEGIDLTSEDIETLSEDNLYFAGVAYNKMVIKNGTTQKYKDYEQSRFGEMTTTMTREFVENEIDLTGDTLITGFSLPEEVVSAEGIVLVDVTAKINSDKPNLAGDDGFDLAAVSVYTKER